MKKVTTNITFGQVLFILFTFCFASLMFFYLGAKFGPQILEISVAPANSRESILPDEAMAQEIQELLNTKKHDFVFQEALESNVVIKSDEIVKSKTVSVDSEDSGVTKQILQDFKQAQTMKSAELTKLPDPSITEFWKNSASSNTVNAKVTSYLEKTAKTVEKPADKPIPPTAKTKMVDKPAIKTVKVAETPPVKVAEPKPDTPQLVKTNETVTQPDLNLDQTEEDTVPVVSSYKLQLGSYSDIKKAQTAAQLWQKRGYSAAVIKTEIPGKGNWYRVRIGGYTDMNEAMNAQRLIMRKYRQSVSVVNLN